MKKINKKTVVSVSIITIVAVVAAYVYFRINDPTTTDNSYPVDQSDGINFNPPTDEEKQRADENKQRIQEREDAINEAQRADNGEKQNVTPAFSYIGKYGTQIEVGSYVPGIYEEGGTCTAKFSRNAETFSRSVQAVKNVSSVDCPVIAVPVSSFPSMGIWSVTVSYNSTNASGESETRTVEVK